VILDRGFPPGELSARRAPEESFFTVNDADFQGVGIS